MNRTLYLTIAVLGVVLGQSKFVPPAFAEEKPPIDTAAIEQARGLKGSSTRRRTYSRSPSREPT